MLGGRPVRQSSTTMNPSLSGFRISIGHRLTAECEVSSVSLSPFQEAVLIVLADAGQDGLSRDRVIALVWGHDDGPKARQRLRQILYSIGRKAGREVVQADGSHLTLSAEVAVDWKDGAAEYKSPIESGALEHWLDGMRVRVGGRRESDLLGSVATARVRDQPRLVLELTRTPESIGASVELVRHRIWALFRVGAETDALALAQTMVRTRRGGHLAASERPLLGRSTLMTQVASLVAGGRQPVVVLGEQGMGKSRFLSHVLAHIQSEWMEVATLTSRATRTARTEPLDLLGKLLQDPVVASALCEVEEPWLGLLRSLIRMPLASPVNPRGVGPGFAMNAYQIALERLLSKAFGGIPIILAIDDFDLADEISQELIEALSESNDISVQVLATSTHKLTDFFSGAASFRLSLLDDQTAIELLQSAHGELSDDEISSIIVLAGGNPGRLLGYSESLAHALPLGGRPLEQLFDRAFEELTEDQQSVLLAMALSHGGLPLNTLVALTGHTPIGVARHLSELHWVGGIEQVDDNFSVRSAGFRDFLRTRLNDAVRVDLHARIADSLLSIAGGAHPREVGWHLLQARRPAEAIPFLEEAADRSAAIGAHRDAYQLLGALLDSLGTPTADQVLRYSEACVSVGAFSEAATRLLEIRDQSQSADSFFECELLRAGCLLEAGESGSFEIVTGLLADPSRSELEWIELVDLGLSIGDYLLDIEIVNTFRDLMTRRLESSAPSSDLDWLGARLCYLGEPARGLQCARSAYEGIQGDIDHSRKTNRYLACLLHLGLLQTDEGQALMRKASERATGETDFGLRFNLLANRGVGLFESGELDAAEAAFTEAESMLGPECDRERTFLLVNRLEMSLASGDLESAETLLSEARQIVPSPRRFANLLVASGNAVLALEQGRLRQAREAVAELGSCQLAFPFSSNASLLVKALVRVPLAIGERRIARSNLDLATQSPIADNRACLDVIQNLSRHLRL